MLKKFLLDLFFPIQCLGGCGAWDFWLCPKCQNKISQPKKIILKNDSGLAGLYYLSAYENKITRSLIRQLKYKYAQDIGRLLGQLLAPLLDQEFDVLMPLPLHKRRLKERGFNQAEIIAKNIFQNVSHNRWLLENKILYRCKYTRPQAQLAMAERALNISQAFGVRQNQLITGKKILLADDVYTTGNTLHEAAQTLKSAGALEIWAITVARAH